MFSITCADGLEVACRPKTIMICSDLMMQTEMKAEEVREVFEQTLPIDVLTEFVNEAKFQQRERKLDAVQLIQSMVIAASTGYGGRQADVMRLYFEMGAKRVVRGGFYAWFNPRLEAVMERVRDHALDFAADHDVDLPGFLGDDVLDWHIVDSMTVKLNDDLKEVFPGAGDYAALKIHKRMSVGIGTTIDYHISPAREHDARHLTIDSSWRNLGLLADLGYASFKLLRDCLEHDVHFVIRLKSSWKPRVAKITRGEVKRTFFRGSDLDGLIASDVLRLNGKVVDMEVELGSGQQALSCRLVGVPTEKGRYQFYLTSLPGQVGPRQICDLYRVRWEIESDNKVDKSCFHLSEITASTEHGVRALVHASMVSTVMVNLIVHRHRMAESPPPKRGAQRTRPPIHPQSLALAMGCTANRIAMALSLEGREAKAEWQRILEFLVHLGQDSNWRNRPSILDQLRGWKISPGRSKKARRASKSAN